MEIVDQGDGQHEQHNLGNDIESGYGLTIGDLFEAATSLLEDHRECLESISGTSEGTFKQRVYFGTPCPRIRVESPIPNPKYSSP